MASLGLVRWRKGFTLTELLVVVGILALLASVLLLGLSQAQRRSLQQVSEVYAWSVLRTVAASHLAMGRDLGRTTLAWGNDCGANRKVRVGEEVFALPPPPSGVTSCRLAFEPARIRVRVVLRSGEELEVSDAL